MTASTTTSPNLPKNPKLVERLRTLLGLPAGTDMNAFADGFKNQGQFIAAVHVSKNLGISFIELKAKMVDGGMSLGQAIQTFPKVSSGVVEASRAQQQAQADLAELSSSTTTETSTTDPTSTAKQKKKTGGQ